MENNDIISFGFNTASVYDINDKNAFIYRLVKESIETIDLSDDDDDDDDGGQANATSDAPAPAPVVKDKIISIENKVIDIGSDSDSEYSGDECLQNIDEMDDQSSDLSSIHTSSLDDDNSSSNSSVYSDDDMYDEGDESNFVVTNTILKCGTPTETISLDTDDEDEDAASDKNKDNDAVPNKTVADSEPSNREIVIDSAPATSSQVDAEDGKDENQEALTQPPSLPPPASVPEEVNGDLVVTQTPDSTQDAPKSPANKANDDDQTQATQEIDPVKDDDPNMLTTTNNNATDATSSAGPSAEEVFAARLNAVKRRMTGNQPKKMSITKAQPLRKRRRTLTEREYHQQKVRKQQTITIEETKRLRKEKLAQLTQKDNEAAPAAPDASDTSPERTPFVPKVKKVNVSRGEQLLTDMMAFEPTND